MKLYCPSCGGALEFRYDDSFVRVCPACRAAIVRTDRGIDSFGQHADLAPTDSGLSLSDQGRFQGTAFELSGRALYRHPKGGSWEEWYLKLADGRWGWLSQAQGDWVITFQTAALREFSPFEELSPGMELSLGESQALTIGECGSSTLVGAEGELPFAFEPGEQSRFVDLGDARGRFATLDYGEAGDGDAPTLFLGRRVSLLELGLTPRLDETGASPARAGQRLGCPNCGGSIELRLPGKSLCVTCPYCASLLDCEGELKILAKLSEGAQLSPIQLGARARFEGVSYVVTGRLRREACYEGAPPFSWDEYLLYAPEAGYRWLSLARGHYSFITPLPPGAVTPSRQSGVRYQGKHFSLYDAARPEVKGVWGEFYWKVSAGERVAARDYVAPPAMLSSEASEDEVTWSLGVYQTPEQVRAAFDLKTLPDERSGVAGNQPFPHQRLPRVALFLTIGFAVCTLLRLLMAGSDQVYAGQFRLGAATRAAPEEASGADALYPHYVFFTPEFQLSERKNLRIEMSTPLHNSWAYATVDLVHEESGERRTFGGEISHYSGVEGGESWSEGSDHQSYLLAAGRAGAHLMRFEVQTPQEVSTSFDVKVTEDVLPWSHIGLVLLAIALPGIPLVLYAWMFESARWSESDYAPAFFGGGTDD